MNIYTEVNLKAPYLIFTGDVDNLTYAKTGAGIVQWRPDLVAGQIRFENNPLDLGVPDMSLDEAVTAGVKSLVIGVAPVGGSVGERWIEVLVQAAALGLDIVSGLHLRLQDYPQLVEAATKSGAELINVRNPPESLPIGTGIKRTGNRLLMVGTDCAVGKKYSALALTQALQDSDVHATFRATGQTGIMISGSGIPVDTVISDFLSGAAELVSPDNTADHWDIIEGQGSLFNPSYAGVSLGLLHGSQPDAIVVCHDPSREYISSTPHIKVPTLSACIELTLQCARLTNPNVYCLGVCVNTSKLDPAIRENYLQSVSTELNMPCVDPIIDGCDLLVKRLKSLS
jgi:uncharacterized NAD-dependent epimerase/dehydratase family protein